MRSIERLYRDHAPALLGYLRRRAVDTTAEDLLQETFVQVLRAPEHVHQAASPRAWLFAIARNVSATAARRHRPTSPLPLHLPSSEAGEDGRLDAVRCAIDSLPQAQREALELRLRDDLSYEEIAIVLDIPVGTVRSRLHNAIQQLRDRLL
jgi:RNA polymerase sigma-70 factor (ECF subfamily)